MTIRKRRRYRRRFFYHDDGCLGKYFYDLEGRHFNADTPLIGLRFRDILTLFIQYCITGISDQVLSAGFSLRECPTRASSCSFEMSLTK